VEYFFEAMWSEFSEDLPNDPTSFGGKVCPVVGNGRVAYNSFENGRIGRGLFYSGMALLDLSSLPGLAKDALKGVAKASALAGIAKEATEIIGKQSSKNLAAAGSIARESGEALTVKSAASSVSLNAGKGKLGGHIAPKEYVDQLTKSVGSITHTKTGDRISITVETFDRGAIDGARAAYESKRVGDVHQGIIRVPKDATFYEIQHELQHALHHVEEGTKFFRLTEAARELEVYYNLKNSPYWKTFSSEEIVDAYRQIMRASNAKPKSPTIVPNVSCLSPW